MRRMGIELVVAAGFVALTLLGPPLGWLGPAGWLVGLLGPKVPLRWRRQVPWGALTVAWLLVVGALAWARIPAVLGLGLMLWWLQVHRRITRHDAGDDRVSVVLAGLMLVAAAGVVQTATFLVPASLFAVALPLSLLPEGRAGRGWGWLPLHVVGSGVCFALLPRPASDPAPAPDVRLTGFAPDVELGALDPLFDDPGVVFRARMQGAPERVYWRGLALDGFDGVRWFSTTPPQPATVAGSQGVAVDVTLGQATDGVIFVPGALTGLALDGVQSDRQGGWFLPAEAQRGAYRVYVSPRTEGEPWFDEPSMERARWLQLPPSLHPDVRSLARSVAGEGSAEARVGRLAAWLEGEVVYTRDGRSASERPLEDFLLIDRRGHCEFVAAGLAVMARAIDVPSRVINGFASGERDPLTGDLVVRRQHAHAWTEVLLEGEWVALDATPRQAAAAPVPPMQRLAESFDAWWRAALVDYDRDDQRALLWASARTVEAWLWLPSVAKTPWRWVLVLVVVAGLVGGLLRLWAVRWLGRLRQRGPAPPQGPVARQHARAREAFRERGLGPPAALPPVDAAEWLARRGPAEAGEAMIALAWLYYECALGEVRGPDRGARARGLAERVVRALQDHGTGEA